LDDIRQIRRQIDDDPFRGTLFEDVRLPPGKGAPRDATRGTDPPAREDSDFAEALKTVSQRARHTDLSSPAARRRQPTRRVPPSGRYPEPTLVGSLRATARLLDLEAADLEQARRYRRADRLRSLAAELRRTARSFDRPPQNDRSLPGPPADRRLSPK
jgi:hypothetical protein